MAGSEPPQTSTAASSSIDGSKRDTPAATLTPSTPSTSSAVPDDANTASMADKGDSLEIKQKDRTTEALAAKTDVNASLTTDGTATAASRKQSACGKHSNTHSKSDKSKKSSKKSKKKSKKKKKSKSKKNKVDTDSSSSDSSSSDSDLDEEDDSSSDSDSSDSDTSSESDSSDSEADQKKLKKKKKKKAKERARRLKEKKKARARRQEETEDSSDSDDEDSSDADQTKKQKEKQKATKKLVKKLLKQQAELEEEEEDVNTTNNNGLTRDQKLAQLQQIQIRNMRRFRRGLVDPPPVDTTGQRQARAKAKKGKRASKVAFKRVDQLWDSTIHNYKLTETVKDPGADEWDQYIFTVRRKFDWENRYTDTVVDIKSKPLRDALAHIMDGVKGVSLVQDTPAAHLKILVKYPDKDYAETKNALYPLLDNNTITYDLLWALFKPNTIAYTQTYGTPDEPRAFKIEYASKESSFMRGQWYSIEGRYLEYDGKSFGMGTMSAEVDHFKGPRKISSLACYPLKYHRDPEALREQLIERGKKFVALQGMNYRFHKGMAFVKRKRSVIKVNINGRIMVDPALHRRINPNYAISTVKPKEPDLTMEADGGDDSDDSCCGSDSGSEGGDASGESFKPKTRLKIVQDKEGKTHVVAMECDENGNEIPKEDIAKLNDEQTVEYEFTQEELLIASPVVLGFAFSEKLWLEFTVSGITDIDWNSGAFDSLVLPANQKSIVKALVESHTFHAAENIDDVIQGKGRGLVAVLHGPPGTGKTLTAEGIAELLKRPLYMVSAGELGTDSRTLEGELNKILDIAHSWGAVLLLDEADVFLEKRTIQDIHRNALVSIFLRLLEYFQGILFLTTNRVETFDDAFQSRIHVALRYGDLTTKAKRSVWKMFLDRVQTKDGLEVVKFSDKDYDALARHNLNGRQIKNSVRTAQALAINEKVPLSMEHIMRVLDVAETFEQDLKGGTGYMDAMRSYT
ncbi:cylicin-1 [Microsporum canis CBS 113480]|uniref:Cylicin-1 n=1 Tax=Arthroderma otae (strain ATCC MYA-4605 / CBS 113480) TaxID=554155 RepID=C5FN38_ARTOC|nr:cylicin-1 [Microsporum canis CBS 113480]EEQ31274.1 cylicin-1 [Microsporum canis CBS 113480]